MSMKRTILPAAAVFWMLPYLMAVPSLLAAGGENLLKVPDFEIDPGAQKIVSSIKKGRLVRFYSNPEQGYYMNVSDNKRTSSRRHFTALFDADSGFRTGRYSLKIDTTGIKDSLYRVNINSFPALDYSPNTTYEFTCRLKSSRQESQVRLYIIYEPDDNKPRYKYQDVTVGKKWKKFTIQLSSDSFNRAKRSHTRIELKTPDSVLWIDGLELKKTGADESDTSAHAGKDSETALYTDSSRKKFNNNWYFLSPLYTDDYDENSLRNGMIPKSAALVNLPYGWNDIENVPSEYRDVYPVMLDEPNGIGWYFKVLSEPLPQGAMSLKFEGISASCQVWLNGKLVKTNLGAYTPFEAPLTNLRRDGSDILAVKVIDKTSLELLPEIENPGPFSKSRRYKRWPIPMGTGASLIAGGIWRDVWLVQRRVSWMQTPDISSSLTKIQVSPVLHGDSSNTEVICELFDADGKKVAESASKEQNPIVLRPKKPKPWHPRTPYLYKLRTSLSRSGEILQVIEQPVSFFDISIRNSEFYINQVPYFLRGQNGPPHTLVPQDREYIRSYIGKLKELGVEIIRFHTAPPTHAWLDECDRQGIMVILESAIYGSIGCYPFDREEFLENAEKEMLAVVAEYKRHPSIVMWCLGNEMIVSSERDIGLAPQFTAVMQRWSSALRQIDDRPIVANSGGDGTEFVHQIAGDVDDRHQYGGWYVETLRDLRNLEPYVRKNDMLAQPYINVESVAAYTGPDGRFLQDYRQRRVTAQRLAPLFHNSPQRSLSLQAFILKEYAEAIWRFRRDDTTVSGYIPFGQYTWFFDPFGNGKTALGEKPIWKMYRKVMAPVHVQLECWSRHLYTDDVLRGTVRLNHEDVLLPRTLPVTIRMKFKGTETVIFETKTTVKYHDSVEIPVKLPVSVRSAGKKELELKVFYNGVCIAENEIGLRFFEPLKKDKQLRVNVYDPAGLLGGLEKLVDCRFIEELSAIDFSDVNVPLVLGPFSFDRQVTGYKQTLADFCQRGGKLIILEQNPDKYTKDLLDMGIRVQRQTAPYWSPWARNLVRHSDRADIVIPEHPVFQGIEQDDLEWWNEDTFVANAYLFPLKFGKDDIVLSHIGNGLAKTELMPVEHPQLDMSYSPLMIEKRIGKGTVLFCQLLVGSKFETEPAAKKMLLNMIRDSAMPLR